MSFIEPPRAPLPLTEEADQPLSATGRVILGMVGIGKTTGYDIKQLVDQSTRFFWAASYGQIYPELRRLEQSGLLLSREEPTGGRSRTVYELTDAGRRAVETWLGSDESLVGEIRDEGLLKLFFSDLAGPERQREILRQMADAYRLKLDQLCKLNPMRSGPQLTLEFGKGATQWMIDWCEQVERRLASEED